MYLYILNGDKLEDTIFINTNKNIISEIEESLDKNGKNKTIIVSEILTYNPIQDLFHKTKNIK